MVNESLATYLNDHLAGSVAALELLAALAEEREGTADAAILARMRADIEEDRATLVQYMERLGIPASKPRQATAWVAEKLVDLKLRLDDPGHGALRRLQTLETVSLGIEGKRLLATALLAAAAEPDIAAFGDDGEALERRAEEQRALVESLRLEAAREAFGS